MASRPIKAPGAREIYRYGFPPKRPRRRFKSHPPINCDLSEETVCSRMNGFIREVP